MNTYATVKCDCGNYTAVAVPSGGQPAADRSFLRQRLDESFTDHMPLFSGFAVHLVSPRTGTCSYLIPSGHLKAIFQPPRA